MVLLDAITGSWKSAFFGHAGKITSLAFSLDGVLLVSGSEDKTVKLWDVQTGGAIKTFDHTSAVSAICISPDCATIASGTYDGTIYLWDIRTGECHSTALSHDDRVQAISFSPINSRRLISSSWDRTVRRWDTDGRQIGATCEEAGTVAYVAYALDGTRFVSCGGMVATVRDSESGAVVVKFDAPKQPFILESCCFSPDGRFVACAAGRTIYVWDITGSGARLVGTLVGHHYIISITFSSSLISLSGRFIKFWQSSGSLTDSIATNDRPARHGRARNESISIRLFAEDGITVTIHSSGVVKTWSLTTGACKSSFLTPAQGIRYVHLAGDTPVVVWWEADDEEYRVWDGGDGQLFRTVRSSLQGILHLRISKDGSKIFGLDNEHIEVRSIPTGEGVSLIRHKSGDPWRDVRGSKVWLASSKYVGWDFGEREVSTFSHQENSRINLGWSFNPNGPTSTDPGSGTLSQEDRFSVSRRGTKKLT